MSSTESEAKKSRAVSEFFDTSYQWWPEIYNGVPSRGFLGFEMLRRKQVVVKLLTVHKNAQADLLDCGCGPGGIIEDICDSGFKIAGVDINFRFLSMARDKLDGKGNFVQADLERLPFAGNQFDIILCIGVLSYLQEDRQAVSQISRVMKPGATAILAVPNLIRVNFLFDPYYYVFGVINYFYTRRRKNRESKKFSKDSIRRYTFGSLRKTCRDFGLEEQEKIGIGFGPFTVWKRPLFSLQTSIKICDILHKIARRKMFSWLNLFANHWVILLQKT